MADRIRFFLIPIFFIALFGYFYPYHVYAKDKVVTFYGDDEKKLCSFKVELASTPQEHEKGLMFKKSLGQNTGMLFIFNNDEIRFFWMRNTFISLDMVFIDSRFMVADIYRFAKPHDETTIASKVPAKYVLEINGGTADRCNLKVGTKAGFTGFSPR
ncbi:MAG: DUF192 domain-containing protein [Proteobacteria bacterium]|nr:DUF192 domain-containing protein [Pseudomonadota bacterium]